VVHTLYPNTEIRITLDSQPALQSQTAPSADIGPGFASPVGVDVPKCADESVVRVREFGRQRHRLRRTRSRTKASILGILL